VSEEQVAFGIGDENFCASIAKELGLKADKRRIVQLRLTLLITGDTHGHGIMPLLKWFDCTCTRTIVSIQGEGTLPSYNHHSTHKRSGTWYPRKRSSCSPSVAHNNTRRP
jgi:hypothetical protein